MRIGSLRGLQTLHTVARLGSVSLAADELHLSQSAVSVQISELEACFGAQLVVRTGRGVRLTEAGEILDGYADRLLKVWDEAHDDIATFLGECSGTLEVGVVTTAECWLPRLLVNFANENPRVKVKLQVGNRDAIVRKLVAQEIDLAVMGQPPHELKVAAAAFAKNVVAFVAAPGHALMSHGQATLETLADARLLVRERGSGSRATVERIFKEAGLRLRIGSELSSNESLKQMCVAGFGPAYLSLQTCALEIDAGQLCVIPMPNNPFEREWFVVRLASREMPGIATVFEQFLCRSGEQEIRRLLPSQWRQSA
jgi:DNA-binding transcriptional LysR family regulator